MGAEEDSGLGEECRRRYRILEGVVTWRGRVQRVCVVTWGKRGLKSRAVFWRR